MVMRGSSVLVLLGCLLAALHVPGKLNTKTQHPILWPASGHESAQQCQCLGVRCIIGHPSSGQMWGATMGTYLSVCSNTLWTLLLHVSFIWGECLSQDQVFTHIKTQFIATSVGPKQFYVGWTLQTNLSKDEDTWGHWTTLSVTELWIICGAGDTCWGTDKMITYIYLCKQIWCIK